MSRNPYEILLFYKYVTISFPEAVMAWQRDLCRELGIKGRLIIATEGINVTLEGTRENTQKYIDTLTQDPRFSDIHFKRSEGTGNAFPRLSVKVRPEIVSLHLGDGDVNPNQLTGKRLTPEELHRWFEEGEDFAIIDMRNDYEYHVGQFEGSILPALKNFRDLQNIMPELEHLKDKKILSVCTGGVRCEKASGYLLAQGFREVYQLDGGIVSYMEKYPNQHFLGKLYVFDGRTTMGFETDSPDHTVIGQCYHCGKASDEYGDCANKACPRHLVCCRECRVLDGQVFCSESCKEAVMV